MEMLSEEYGWTPNEIRCQRNDDINSYIQIIRVKRIIEKAEQKKLNRNVR